MWKVNCTPDLKKKKKKKKTLDKYVFFMFSGLKKSEMLTETEGRTFSVFQNVFWNEILQSISLNEMLLYLLCLLFIKDIHTK